MSNEPEFQKVIIRRPDIPHRNADTRIREAFDALRVELRDIFGEPYDDVIASCDASLEWIQDDLHDFAKLPADA